MASGRAKKQISVALCILASRKTEGWLSLDDTGSTPKQMIESPYCCKRCRAKLEVK